MDPKIELYAAICGVLDRPDASAAIWELLQNYTVAKTAASASLPDSIQEFVNPSAKGKSCHSISASALSA